MNHAPTPRSLGAYQIADKRVEPWFYALSADASRAFLPSRFERIVNPVPVVPVQVLSPVCDSCGQEPEEIEYEEIN